MNETMAPQAVPAAPQRFVLDSAIGVTNFVSDAPFYVALTRALDSFIAQLRSVCGPSSRYSLLITPDMFSGTQAGSVHDARAFLKDGRYLIQHSEYLSPLENYLKSMILYIGTSIDNICHDGTTTAMLYACHLLKVLVNVDVDDTRMMMRRTTYSIEQKYREVFARILSEMEKYKLTLESFPEHTRKDAAEFMAYTQAMTSSGGDVELSRELSKFFREMPEVAWTKVINQRIPSTENRDERIRAVACDYEIEVAAQCMDVLERNHDNGNTYKNDDADLLIIPTALPDSSVTTQELYIYLREHESSDRPLVLMIPAAGVGDTVISELQSIAYERKLKLIIECYRVPSNVNTQVWWDIEAIPAKANMPCYSPFEQYSMQDCVIPHVSVIIGNRYIRLDKITPVDERLPEDTNTHPGDSYPEDYPYYTKFKERLDGELKFQNERHRKDTSLLNYIEPIVTFLSVRYPVIMRLGGMAHDVSAIIPVVEDAAGAAMATIKHGYYTNGIFRLAFAGYVVNKMYQNEHDDLGTLISSKIYTASERTARDIFGPNKELHSSNYAFAQEVLAKSPMLYWDIARSDGVSNLEDYISEFVKGDHDKLHDLPTPPLQPAVFITELLDRCRELVVKLSLTTSVVVPGTAWLNKEKDNGDSANR